MCGQNGESYNSVCAAYSDRVAVDYYGPCQAVGALSHYSSQGECVSVQCPPLSANGCKPVLPPGEHMDHYKLRYVSVSRALGWALLEWSFRASLQMLNLPVGNLVFIICKCETCFPVHSSSTVEE